MLYRILIRATVPLPHFNDIYKQEAGGHCVGWHHHGKYIWSTADREYADVLARNLLHRDDVTHTRVVCYQEGA